VESVGDQGRGRAGTLPAGPSAGGFGFLEEVGVQAAAGVEDLDADEASSFQSRAMNPSMAGGVPAWMVVRPGVSGSPVRPM